MRPPREHPTALGTMPFVVLFVSAFGAATILPFPSEVPLLFVVRDTGQVFWPVVVATCGNYLGAGTTYALARMAVSRFVSPESRKWSRASEAIKRFGAPVLLFSWLPIIGDAMVGVAGAAGMPFAVLPLDRHRQGRTIYRGRLGISR